MKPNATDLIDCKKCGMTHAAYIQGCCVTSKSDATGNGWDTVPRRGKEATAMRFGRDEDLYVSLGIDASEIVKQLERKAATGDCNIQRTLNRLAAEALALADGWDRGKLTLGQVSAMAEELRHGYARVPV